MSRTKRCIRYGLVAFGLLLLAAGSGAAYWCYYKVAPTRHLLDPAWLATHSEAARWEEEQKDYLRMGTSPDMCDRRDQIGFYGDKQWFLWLEDRARTRHREGFMVCGCTEYALALMANRHVDSWEQWADANRNRSQEEWIKDGFSEYGVAVQLPPSRDDAVPLLRLLGRQSSNFLFGGPDPEEAPEAVPSYVHYNAYRWLRDFGFRPWRFMESNATVAAEPEIAAGLLTYSQWQSAYPGQDQLGVLAFGKSVASGFDDASARTSRSLGLGFGSMC